MCDGLADLVQSQCSLEAQAQKVWPGINLRTAVEGEGGEDEKRLMLSLASCGNPSEGQGSDR